MSENASDSPSSSARLSWRDRMLFKVINLYPPYLGAGVKVTRFEPDLSELEVRMKLRWWNRNYLGTHFGGSLYSMCDPFLVLMMSKRLGSGYVVWDKAAKIRFRRPGTCTVYARFQLEDEEVERIRSLAETEPKVEPTYHVQVVDEEGQLVAQVEKLLYVRKKPPKGEKADG